MAPDPSAGGRGFDARPLVALLVVAAAWVVLTRPWLSGTYAVPWDAEAHFRPQMAFLAHSIAAGESPAWNPYVFSGWVQIADPQSLLFVLAFLILSLFVSDPGSVALDATVYAQLGVGAAALLLWFRDRGWHVGGGTVAALAFAFGGSAAWRIQHTGQVLSFAVIPVVLFLLERMIARRSIGWGFAAGLAAGFLAVGRDQIALLGLYFLVAYAVVSILAPADRWSRLGGSLLPGLAGVIGGLLVVTVPVTMTLLLSEQSNRPAIDFIGAGKGSLHPVSLIGAAIADLFGQGAQDVDFWGPPSEAFGVTEVYLAQNMTAIYAGALPAVTILVLGIGRGLLWRREIRFHTLAAVFFVLYGLGWYTPAFRVFYDHLPGVALYRRPADATFLMGFSLAVLGGWLVHLRLTEDIAPAGRLARTLQVALLVAVFAALPIAFGLHANRLPLVWKPLATAALFSAAALVVLTLAARANRAGTAGAFLAIALLGGFTTVDLAWNNAPNESTAYPAATFMGLDHDSRDPLVPFLKQKVAEGRGGDRRDRVELAGVGFHWPNAGMVHGLENTLGYNPLRFAEYARATGAIDHSGLPEQKEFSPLEPSYDSLLVDMLGLRWIVTGAPVETMDKKLAPGRLIEVARFPAIPGIPPAPGRAEIHVYENPRAMARVRFVDAARPADFEAITKSGTWPEGFDPHREVLLPAAALPGGAVAGDPASPAGRATIAAYHNTRVEVDVEAARPGWLVLGDVWHRWWSVEVDGRPAEIARADVLFRAVRLDAGRHRVTFVFRPFSGLLTDLEARISSKLGRSPRS